MDINKNQEMGEPTPTRKVSLDELSREDLLKKCKALVALAQKAKQAKDDALKEVAHHKTNIVELAERCQSAEDKSEKSLVKIEKLTEQLEATQELLAAQQKLCNQTEALVDERVTALTVSVKAENAELLSELNAMNQVLKQRGELISKMEACHTEFETQIKQLEANHHQSADTLRLKNSELESVVCVQREKIDELENKLATANDLESSLKNSLAQQTEKISELEGKVSSLETAIQDFKMQIEAHNNSLCEKDTKIAELSSRLKCETERREEIEKKLIELQVVVDERSRVIENLKSSLTDDEKLEDQVCALKNELAALSRDKDHSESSLNQTKLKLATTETELSETLTKLQDQVDATEELNRMRDELEKKLSELQQEKLKLASTETELSETLTKLQDQVAATEELNRMRDELEKKLSELQQEKESSDCQLKEVFSEREEQLKKSQENLDTLQKEIDGKVVELEKTRENLQSEFEDRLGGLEREKENLLQKLSRSREEVQCGDDLKSKFSELQEQFEQLETAKEELVEELGCSRQCEEEVRLKLSEVQSKVEVFEKENENLVRELESSNERLELEEEAKLKLERKLEKLSETISALEVSLANRDELLRSSEEAVNELTAQLDVNAKEGASMKAEVEKSTALLTEAQSKLAKYQEESDGRIHTQLEEASSAVLSLREELIKEREHLRKTTELVSDLEKRMEQAVAQGNETQKLLDQRTASLQDAERELLAHRDSHGASEVANTEVSSNLSMSRTEEAARLKDVEDSFEDKYTKLRYVAAKLKRRVNDLSQTLESERAKFSKDLAEQQGIVVTLTSQLKTTHTLQAECDRLQDKVDAQHSELKELQKNLESAVTEAANAKLQLAESRETASKAAAEKKKFEQECVELQARIVMLESSNTEVAVVTRELRQMEKKLEQSKEEALKLTADVEAARSDAKKKSVLSLEMADYEKSVADLTQQLSSERQRIKTLEEQISDQQKLSSQLQDRLNKEEAQTKKLTEQLNSTKERLSSLGSESEKKDVDMKDLNSRLESALAEVEGLQLQCSELGAQLSREKAASRSQIDSLTSQVFQLEELCSQARERATISEEELSSLQAEFESYKVRAQSVLRQSARSQDDLHSSHSPRSAEEFEELEQELERLRLSLEVSRANVQTTTAQLQSAQQDLSNEREDKARLSRTMKSLRESLTSATERQRAAEEALAITTDDLRQAKLNSDMLVQCYKQQFDDANASHQKALASMSEELETLRTSIQDDRESPNALLGVSTAVPTETVTRMAAIHREEGEGSESVESYSARRSSVISQDPRSEIVPLDKLLSSSLSDDHGINHMASVELAATQEQLAACESRVAHLTALLSEVESDAARISQLNSVLKEEIRRQQRSDERTELAHNLEYLKNVVLKFVTLQNDDERARLVPVLNTILKLSPEEVAALSSAAKGRESTASGWSSYLAGWSG